LIRGITPFLSSVPLPLSGLLLALLGLLFFIPNPQVLNNKMSTNDRFCTNCGNPISEQAVACMSCGAKPDGHKKFCRHCGVALNPEQVVCVKCGTGITTASVTPFAGFGVGDITVLVAAALAFLSYFLPWIDFEMRTLNAFKVCQVAFEPDSPAPVWFGLVFFVFIYPVLMVLIKQIINLIGGCLCAIAGIVLGIKFIIRCQEKIFEQSVNVAGAGCYLFICACVALIIGSVIQHQSKIREDTRTTWMAFTSIDLGVAVLVYYVYASFASMTVLQQSDLVIRGHFLNYTELLCWITIILGVVLGHRGLKTTKGKFRTSGLLLCGVAYPAFLLQWPLYNLLYQGLFPLDFALQILRNFALDALLPQSVFILGVFFGHKGLKMGARKTAKLGLLFCWITCWMICFTQALWVLCHY